MHPLTGNLQNLNDNDLNEKIKQLHQRLLWAYAASPNSVSQIQLLLDDYAEERSRRDNVAMEKLMNQNKDKSKDWNDIIDIGKKS
jgi:hypothetical protein